MASSGSNHSTQSRAVLSAVGGAMSVDSLKKERLSMELDFLVRIVEKLGESLEIGQFLSKEWKGSTVLFLRKLEKSLPPGHKNQARIMAFSVRSDVEKMPVEGSKFSEKIKNNFPEVVLKTIEDIEGLVMALKDLDETDLSM